MKKKVFHLLASKKAVVGIVGAGYVGLPLAQLISKKFSIILYDHDEKKIRKIKTSQNKFFRKKDKTIITYDIKMLRKANFIIICLPTPLKSKREPDLSHIHAFFRKKNYFISPNQTIILESTSYPGTSEEMIKKYFSSKKYKFGENIFFGYSPERVDPGRNLNLSKIPKIVSGFSQNCKKIVKTFYSKIFNKVFETSSMSTAEVTKLYENIYRSVNIALVNEMKMISHKLNLDIYEIISAYYALNIVLSKNLIKKRKYLINKLKLNGIGTSIYYPKIISDLTYYKKKYKIKDANFPNAKKISYECITLPIGPHINLAGINYIANRLKKNLRDLVK